MVWVTIWALPSFHEGTDLATNRTPPGLNLGGEHTWSSPALTHSPFISWLVCNRGSLCLLEFAIPLHHPPTGLGLQYPAPMPDLVCSFSMLCAALPPSEGLVGYQLPLHLLNAKRGNRRERKREKAEKYRNIISICFSSDDAFYWLI